MNAKHSILALFGWLAMTAGGMAQYGGYPQYGTNPYNTAPYNRVAQAPNFGVPTPAERVFTPQTAPMGSNYGAPSYGTPSYGASSYSAPPTSSPSYAAPAYGPPPAGAATPSGQYPPIPNAAPTPAGSTKGVFPSQSWGPASPTPNFNRFDHELTPFGQQAFADPGNSCTSCAGGAGSGGGCDSCNSCGSDSCGSCCGGPRWFGSVAGLIMTRNNGNRAVLTTLSSDDNADVMSSRDHAYDWRGGVETRIGRAFGCTSAIEASYFWLDPFVTTASVTPAAVPAGDAIDTALCFCNLSVGGVPLNAFFNGSAIQEFHRRDEIHNLEINWLENSPCCAGRFSFTGIAGTRWFHFSEGTSFGAAMAGTAFGDNGGTTSAFFNQKLVNNFVGSQLGARAQFFVTPRLRVYATPKVGIGAITIDKHVGVQRGDGLAVIDEKSYKSDVAMLSQLDAGASFQFTPGLSAFIGYRVLGVAGLALFENNIPRQFTATDEVRDVRSNGSLLLHGAIFGGQFAF